MATRSRSNPNQVLQTQYLVGYNLVCAVLWTAVLGRVILLVPLVGFGNVHGGVGEFTKWTQTLALLEIVHSASGLVRSPLLTTILQVSSRLFLIWAVVDRYPSSTGSSIFYSSMLLAWSVTEVIRYSYFVWNLQGNGVPGFMTWLRYNTFYVLYPIGIFSECVLIWNASMVAERPLQLLFWVVLGVYVPGTYVLFTHMITQRRKIMRGKGVDRRN
ncbi:tyrosine phosphatase-like protein [Usnea florida]